MDPTLGALAKLARKRGKVTVDEVRDMISMISSFTFNCLVNAGHDARSVRAVCTKFRDAGRRSPPWRPASARVPGRPQDGADGNRRNRWLFEKDHKFFATEIEATLVEVKYYLELLSMQGAPPLPEDTIRNAFDWLVDHPVIPGAYLDPLQLVPIVLETFLKDRRYVESGHIVPLDRGGKHDRSNAFLCLASSNRIQGSLNFDELLKLMEAIVVKHRGGIVAGTPQA